MPGPVPADELDVSEVQPGLWLGAAPDRLDERRAERQVRAFAVRAPVRLIVDCRLGADDGDLWRTRRGIEYVNAGVDDAGTPIPDHFFTRGVELVFPRWRTSQLDVLIHCESGAHRSPALALAVLLVDGLHTEAATNRIRAARPAVRPRYFDDAMRWYGGFAGQ